MIQIESLDNSGKFQGYLAAPAGKGGPGVLVIQEIFGVNAGMRALCDDLAQQGYFALCPDLFWRQQPGVQLTDKTDDEWQRAFALYQGFDVDKGVNDLMAAMGALRKLAGCSGVVGAVGYCLGGKLAYLMATRTDVDAAISYYGVGLEDMLDEMPEIRRPLLMHIAAEDKFVTKEAQQKILAAAARNPHVVAHVYAGVDHAFARPGGQNFQAEAAQLAHARSAQFLAAHLKKGGAH
ncbi:MAG: dienelactone hydrolase family protein [Alphaproteobacteria bacterium]|nr:dienelactone hydrolase family protein [Alphaproteobacteria bacterium]